MWIRNNSHLLSLCRKKEGMNPPGSLQCMWPWELRAPAKPRTFNDPQEANTIHKPLSTAPVSFILVVSAVGMASLANSSMIHESVLLVFYPEPMPAHFTECPYCRKIYHSIHLHPLQIIIDFRDLSYFYFFSKLKIYIVISSLYIETILNLLYF